MKAKRFLSLMLSLTLAVSLTAPALAMEAPALPGPEAMEEELTTALEEFYHPYSVEFAQQYKLDHPEEYAAFDADAWFAQEWDFYDSKEEYLADYGLTEELFREAMWVEYTTYTEEYEAAWEVQLTQEQARRIEAYRSEHPGELEGLDLAFLLERKGYREPLQAYMDDMGIATEEAARNALLMEYVESRTLAQERHAQAEAYRAADPASWESFDVDVYLAENYRWYTKEEFMASWGPFYTDEELADYLYIEFMEGKSNPWDRRDLSLVVNGQTNYDATVTEANWVTYTDGATLNAILGTDYPDGESVSIREAATAAGWDVVWNATGNEVVLLDRERLRAGNIYPQDLDIPAPDFTAFDGLMNRLLADGAYDADKTYRVDQTQKLTFTALNSLDGDKTVTATLTGRITTGGTAMEAEYTLSCAQLLELLSPQVQAQLEGILPKFKREDVKSLLTAGKLTIRADLETGDTYVHAPILALFDDSFAGDTWIHTQADFSGSLALLDMAREGSWDTKAFLYDTLLASSADSWSAENSYSAFQQSYGMLSALAGPHFLTEENGVYTWTLNSDALALLGSSVAGYMAQEDYDFGKFFKEFDLTLRVDKNAQMTLDMVIRPDMDALGAFIATEDGYGETDPAQTALITWMMNLLDFRATAHASGDADDLTEESTFHWKNQFKATVESKTTRRTTNTAPNALPPAGANIVEF